jgi:hypothetical protein
MKYSRKVLINWTSASKELTAAKWETPEHWSSDHTAWLLAPRNLVRVFVGKPQRPELHAIYDKIGP